MGAAAGDWHVLDGPAYRSVGYFCTDWFAFFPDVHRCPHYHEEDEGKTGGLEQSGAVGQKNRRIAIDLFVFLCPLFFLLPMTELVGLDQSLSAWILCQLF